MERRRKKWLRLQRRALRLKFQIESQAIYYRKNYNWGMVVWNLVLLELFDFLTLIKKLLFMKRNLPVKDVFGHMALVWSIHFKTGLGSKCNSLGSPRARSRQLVPNLVTVIRLVSSWRTDRSTPRRLTPASSFGVALTTPPLRDQTLCRWTFVGS